MAGHSGEFEGRRVSEVREQVFKVDFRRSQRLVFDGGDTQIIFEVKKNLPVLPNHEKFIPNPERLQILANYEQTAAHVLLASSMLERTSRGEPPSGDTQALGNTDIPRLVDAENSGEFVIETRGLKARGDIPLWIAQERIRHSKLLLPATGSTLGAYDPSVTRKVAWMVQTAEDVYNGVEEDPRQ